MKADISSLDIISSSFRDPSGFVYFESGIVKRFVNLSYKQHYDFLVSSGLKAKLQDSNYLIRDCEEAPENLSKDAYKILIPEQLPFISYPYEWSFSALKDAALLTLEVQRLALQHGMTLKDATAFNVQFLRGKPILIDTLSFEILDNSKAWCAYRQFCQHFLAPLALIARASVELGKLSSLSIDGIPLDYAAKLLPWSTRLSPRLFFHLHLHARSLTFGKHSPANVPKKNAISLNSRLGMIDSLIATITAINWKPKKSAWRDYYTATNYSEDAFAYKKECITSWAEQSEAKLILDLGANSGVFSKLAALCPGSYVLATDYDANAVELNYLEVKKENIQNLLPLILDIVNPSPAIGWSNLERAAFFNRSHFDLTLVLALIHHLVIAEGIPLEMVIAMLARISKKLIIEFVPKQDSQVQRMLASRQDIFDDYNQEVFETSLRKYFSIIERKVIPASDRIIYFAANIKT